MHDRGALQQQYPTAERGEGEGVAAETRGGVEHEGRAELLHAYRQRDPLRPARGGEAMTQRGRVKVDTGGRGRARRVANYAQPAVIEAQPVTEGRRVGVAVMRHPGQ